MKSFFQIVKGLLLRGETSDPSDNKNGSLWYNSTSNRIKGYVESAVRIFVTEDQTQTLSNKTLTTPTIADFTNAQHDHSNAAGGGQVDHTDLTSIGANSHSQIDTHIAASAAHGTTGNIVGTSDSQTLTNKTIDGDDNTVQDLALSSLKTVLADANKLIVRDGAGVVVSSSSLPSAVTGATLQDNSFILQDNGDLTKQLKFEASGITTGTTRTLTAPDADTTIVGTAVSQTLTNKTIDADSNSISNIEDADIKVGAAIARAKLASGTADNVIINDGSGVLSSEASLAISRGGTGQSTQTAAFDALAPSTTKGDVIVHNGTDNIRVAVGTNSQVLTADSAEASGVKWATPAGGSGLAVTAVLTANYTASVNDFVLCNSSGGAFTITLPTAVGNTNSSIKIQKIESSNIAVTINTTSSQTIGGRASGDVKCYQYGDFLEVISDGTNWQILDKKETQFLNSWNSAEFSTVGAAGNYAADAATVNLPYGVWEVDGSLLLAAGTGIAASLLDATGFYAAAGANSSSAPTALGSEVINGIKYYTDIQNGGPMSYINTSNPGNFSRFGTSTLKTVISVTSNKAVYLVAQIDYSTAGTAIVYSSIQAKRIW